MELLRRKEEELRKKVMGKVQGTQAVPGTKPKTESKADDNPARKKLRMVGEEEDKVEKVARRRPTVSLNLDEVKTTRAVEKELTNTEVVDE